MAFLLDVPIGYTKNPMEPQHTPPRSFTPCFEPPSSSILDGLPHEICSLVALFLNQHDTLNLALTCKELAAACLPRLYHTINVDADYTEFSKEYDLSSTYIKSSYSFKKLIQRYRRQFPIHTLSVVSLPDSMNIYDIDINEQLLRFFSTLDGLHSLSWLSDNFKLEYLKRLPCQASVHKLNLNIKFSNYLGELTTGCPLFHFVNLRDFHIRPFYNQSRLVKIIDCLLVCADADAVERNLHSLRLSRFDKDTNAVLPSPRELDSALWETAAREGLYTPQPREYELGTLQAVFKKSNLRHVKLSLTELCLNDFLVCEKDAQLLTIATDLAKLRRLELRNVSEYCQARLEEASPGFLGTLAPLLSSLTHLNVDYRETRRDSVPLLLASCPGLLELDLVIRMNEIKAQHVDVESLYSEYAAKLSEQTKLKKLSVELREENSFCDVAQPTPTVLIQGIRKLRQLLALRLNPSDSNHGVEEFLRLLRNLSRLEVLDVFGTRAGGAPHMALGAVHPNVYDEWFKVQHVAFLYGETQKSLRYVRINKCIFEHTGTMEPRNEIDRWFEGRVRVGD